MTLNIKSPKHVFISRIEILANYLGAIGKSLKDANMNNYAGKIEHAQTLIGSACAEIDNIIRTDIAEMEKEEDA